MLLDQAMNGLMTTTNPCCNLLHVCISKARGAQQRPSNTTDPNPTNTHGLKPHITPVNNTRLAERYTCMRGMHASTDDLMHLAWDFNMTVLLLKAAVNGYNQSMASSPCTAF